MSSCDINIALVSKVLVWLLVNAIVPILIPVVCIWGADWFFRESTTGFWDLCKDFMFQGYYVFSALTLICSLFEDYRAMRYCVNTWHSIIIGVLMTLTMGMFYVQYINSCYLQSHYMQFMIVWGALVLYAILIKFQIVIYKRKNNGF